jgi:hypothetical protein
MFHTPADDREGERKRDPDVNGERERGRENRQEYVVFRPNLSLYPATERGRAWVSAGSG